MVERENTTKVHRVLDILDELYDIEIRLETEHANPLNSNTLREIIGDYKEVVKAQINTIRNKDVIW